MRNGDTPAMPQDSELHFNEIGLCPTLGQGVTKREYFAGMAMQSLISSDYADDSDKRCADETALLAVEYANALLRALED